MGTDGIQKVPVVGDHQDRIFIIGEVIFQPADRIQVQVVGGFIQQQVIGFSKECLGQQHPYFLLSTQIFHQGVVQSLFDSQVTQQGGCIAFGIPAIHVGKFLLQF